MARVRTRKDAVQDAADAHTSLILFSTIKDLSEGGDIESEYMSFCQRIQRICDQATAQCLNDFDRFVAEATK